jgi:hypothetical protein
MQTRRVTEVLQALPNPFSPLPVAAGVAEKEFGHRAVPKLTRTKKVRAAECQWHPTDRHRNGNEDRCRRCVIVASCDG